jgi:hypothetical protein
MPSIETLERFIARVEENAHAEAVDEFHAKNSSMQENQLPPRIGRAHHVSHERAVLAKAKSMNSTCIRPVLINGDIVVIRWVFEFVWLNDSVTRMEEIAYQRWDGERIVEEQFFYDPAQRTPKSA